jgi:hypothetical protein
MPSEYDRFVNTTSRFLHPLDALAFRSAFSPSDFFDFKTLTLPSLDWPRQQAWEQFIPPWSLEWLSLSLTPWAPILWTP